MLKRDIMQYIMGFLLVCFISLQLAEQHHSSASEEFHPLKQGERIVPGPLLLSETTLYTRDFDGGFIAVEVSDNIIFSITVTSGPLSVPDYIRGCGGRCNTHRVE
jgi:hypothetical protein